MHPMSLGNCRLIVPISKLHISGENGPNLQFVNVPPISKQMEYYNYIILKTHLHKEMLCLVYSHIYMLVCSGGHPPQTIFILP